MSDSRPALQRTLTPGSVLDRIAYRIPSRHRGSCLVWLFAGMLLAPAAEPDEPLPPPSGPVVLVIDGDIKHTNVDGEAHFDLPMLQALPPHVLVTRTTGHDGAQHFEGVRLSALLDRVGAGSSTFVAEAADDYHILFSGIDPERYPVIVAYHHDGAPMSRRQLGPLRIVLPFDDYPQLRSHGTEAMTVWQLVRMSVR